MARRVLLIVALLAGLSALSPPPARADAVADFYRGRNVTIIVAVSPGGGYDLYTRLLARHMEKHLPGNPSVIVQNMPGGGGLVAANYMYNAADKDGTVLSVPLSGIVVDQLLRPKRVKYDAAKFNWIGAITTITDVISVLDTAPAKTIEEAKQKEVIIGASGKGSQIYQEPALMNAVLGTKFKIVLGYKGGTQVTNAMARGEVHGRSNISTSWALLKPEWVKENRLIHLVQIGPKDPALGDVPSLIDLVTDERDKAMVKVLHVSLNTGRAIYTAPGVPSDRVAALRRAFAATVADPAYRQDMEARKMDLRPTMGEDLQAYVEETLASDTVRQAAVDLKAILE